MPGSTEQGGPGPQAATPERLGLDAGLDHAGINVAGVLAPAAYDALCPPSWQTARMLPAARSAVVLATGGSEFFRAFKRSPESRFEEDALDAFLVRVVEASAAFERGSGYEAATSYYFERRDAVFADFQALAAGAGLGAASRLALLIHPEYGPWLAIRALLVTSRPLAPSRAEPHFAPCDGCPAPCVAGCRGSAVPPGDGGFDLADCQQTSGRDPVCGAGCDARRACVVGPTHRYDADAEAWHRRAALRFPTDEC